jgi:hypothetical protein
MNIGGVQAGLGNLGFNLPALVVKDVSEHDLGAFLGHELGFFSPLASGAAADQRYLAV